MPNRHCHNCGWEYSIPGQPGRTESCHQCGVDLKVCLNCTYYDARVAHQCREKRADPVMDKHLANFCEYFDFIRRDWQGRASDKRADAARENLRKLFDD
jgi:hypothetical protein